VQEGKRKKKVTKKSSENKISIACDSRRRFIPFGSIRCNYYRRITYVN
jgi:hypothetical protein